LSQKLKYTDIMATIWHEGEITAVRQVAATIREFDVIIKNMDTFDFQAGQFVTMDLPIGEKRLQRWRSYSIASAPNDNALLTFCIGKIEGGLATTYFFEQAKVGTILRFKGPTGSFYLPEKIENNLVMICTGTGIVPFKSMIADIFLKKKLHQKIHLIFGCRHEKDILYKDFFEEIKLKIPLFSYDIVLSREEKEGFSQGYVHQVYMTQPTENFVDTHFYLCGWSAMIDEAVKKLTEEKNVPAATIFFERYG
jgi:ferredoxin-NADP reductase